MCDFLRMVLIYLRHGRPVAHPSAVARPKQPVRSLAGFRAKMPQWQRSSATLLREVRDEEL